MRNAAGILNAIGRTPLVEIVKLNPYRDRVRILAKLEGANPCGSVKDRIAAAMISAALESGALVPGKTVVEATSGNTGIGLAMVCAALGFPLLLTMPECVSLERRRILEALGAELILTPAEEGTDGAIREAYRIIEKDPEKYFMPNQFENPANFMAHYRTTGPEIWEQTGGEVHAFVTGVGTTGTLMGVGKFLREKNPEILIAGVEPVEGHSIQGLKNLSESICPGIWNPRRVNRMFFVDDERAFQLARELALKEGVFVGMSSGASLHGALELAKELDPGTTVVCLFPDRGDRYLSTSLFASICAKCPP